MHYLALYLLLGICIAVLAWVGCQLYRQHMAGLRHSGRRARRWFRKHHH